MPHLTYKSFRLVAFNTHSREDKGVGSPIASAQGAFYTVPPGQPFPKSSQPLPNFCWPSKPKLLGIFPGSGGPKIHDQTGRVKTQSQWIEVVAGPLSIFRERRARGLTISAKARTLCVGSISGPRGLCRVDGAIPEAIAPAGLVMSVLRRLEPEDLAMLALEPVKQSSLKKIRDSHHALARVLASGIPNWDASRITGFDATYISIMKADPAFQELLAFYAEHDAGQQADLRERMMLIALDVSVEIRDRLHNDPDSFPHNELRQLLTNLADRVGHGPSSTVHSTVDVTETLSYAEQLALANALKELETLSADNGRDRITLQAQPREESGAQREAEPVSREAETIQPLPGGGHTSS